MLFFILTNAGQQFFSFSFDDPAAVNSLMEKIVTTATTHPAPSARSLAFDCLPKIASLHYDKLAPYMNHVAQVCCPSLINIDAKFDNKYLCTACRPASKLCNRKTTTKFFYQLLSFGPQYVKLKLIET